MTTLRLRERQRGVAVVTALLLTSLAITIVASLFWQQQVQIRSIENQRAQLQKQWVLRGALEWSRLILREDARMSATDNLDEPWAVPLAETPLDDYVEFRRADGAASGVMLSGRMVDAQGRFNLANLCPTDKIDEHEVNAFARLLADLELNPALAVSAAQAIAAAKSKTAEGVNEPARQIGFVYLEDLLAVTGFTPEIVRALRDYVVVLPAPTAVNVNTAPAQVIDARMDALPPGGAAAIVTSRQYAYFRDIGDLLARFPEMKVSANNVSVRSDYFLVNGRVRLGDSTLDIVALVRRTGTDARVIWVHNA